MVFCFWLLSLSTVFSKFIHVVACMCQYLILLYGWILFHCMDICHFLYVLISWQTFGLFLPFGHMNSAAVNIVYKFLCKLSFSSLGYIPRSKITGSYTNSKFNFLRNYQTVWTIIHSYSNVEGLNFSISSAVLVNVHLLN